MPTCTSLPRPHDYSADGFNDWAFMTTHSWDEDPSGDWLLEIENTSDANNYGRGGSLLRPEPNVGAGATPVPAVHVWGPGQALPLLPSCRQCGGPHSASFQAR